MPSLRGAPPRIPSSVISHQSSVTSHQSSVISHQGPPPRIPMRDPTQRVHVTPSQPLQMHVIPCRGCT
eukprot:1285927-Prymnesium_polylepis.1